MKKLVFLRHFRTRIEKDIPSSDWNLDETGVREMREMIENGTFEGYDKIISSTEKKAKVTAEAISERHKIPMELSDDIVEVDRGSGFVEGDYERIVELYLSEENGFNYPWEDISSVRSRAWKFIELLGYETGSILIISHGLFLSVLLSRCLGQEPAKFWKTLGFGQMLEVDYDILRSSLRNCVQ
jgi:broad specificity phosphatase PhoE